MHRFINSSISYRGLILIFIDVSFEITRGETRAKVNRIGFAVTNCVDWFSSLDITLCSPKLTQSWSKDVSLFQQPERGRKFTLTFALLINQPVTRYLFSNKAKLARSSAIKEIFLINFSYRNPFPSRGESRRIPIRMANKIDTFLIVSIYF